MLISPPFLLPRNANETDADYVARCMPDTTLTVPGTRAPEGCFPVSFKLGWHGGLHLQAPAEANNTVAPVRAIADGEIVFVRRPSPRNESPSPGEPRNYNPFGERPAWTDDGCVIIRHTTEIGANEQNQATEVTFLSIYMHLSELRGMAHRVASGGADRRVHRKDEIGVAGKVYGTDRQLHFEIVCDDASLQRLIGRTSGDLDIAVDGRTDTVFGQLYFLLPTGTRFYAQRPALNVATPADTPAHTLEGEAVYVGLRYGGGDGAAGERGDAFLTTYQADGSPVGGAPNAALNENEAEYNLYASATAISNAYPAAARPAPSAVYELLRFGRVIGPDALNPATVPHWRQVRYPGGQGWVNLNAAGVRKFSDADFPHWRGWKLIDDDTDADSRCQSASLTQLIEDPAERDGQLTRAELERRLQLPDVRDKLKKTICKFPSEWNRDTVPARWGWLNGDPEFGLQPDDYAELLAHINALTFPWATANTGMAASHWHWEPREFVTMWRKNLWLSRREMLQLVPDHIIRKPGSHNSPSQGHWEAPALAPANAFLAANGASVNKSLRKFCINSPLRVASFIGNSVQETGWFRDLRESSGNQPNLHLGWYGRGFLQLTNPNGALANGNNNYYKYFRFVGRIPQIPAGQQELAWRDEIGTDAHHAAHSAGAYWTWPGKSAPTSANPNRPQVDNANRYADVPSINQRRTIATAAGTKVWYYDQSFADCAAAVNFPATVGQDPPNMNGLVDRSTAFVNALVVLDDMPTFATTAGETSMTPENFNRRQVP